MAELRDLGAALDEHLEAMARHLDVGPGDPDQIPPRARRQRHRRAARRSTAALAGLALIAGVVGLARDGGESSVDTVDRSEFDAGPSADDETEGRRVESFDGTSPMVIGTVEALDASWGAYVVSRGTGVPDRSGSVEWSTSRLVRSVDGIAWEPVADVALDGFAGITGRDDLLALGFHRDGSVVIESYDGGDWNRAVLPTEGEVRLVSLGSSPTHLFAMVERPGRTEVVRAEAQAALQDRFGDYDHLGMGDDGSLTVTVDGAVVFDGTAAEAGLTQEQIDALVSGPDDLDPSRYELWVSDDGMAWDRGVVPPDDAGDPTPVGWDTDIGLVAGADGGFVHTADGQHWSFVALDGVAAGDRVDVQLGPGWLVASTTTRVATAESLSGPFSPIATSASPDTILETATSARGLVVVENTIESDPSGIDSAAEAESLGLDASAHEPEIRIRVLTSADGRRVVPLDIDLPAVRSFMLHAIAGDGRIVVRSQDRTDEFVSLGGGYLIDPGA